MSATPPVVRTVHVHRSLDEAFRVFTDEIGRWWPLETHSPADHPSTVAFNNGRLVETDSAGETSDWGAVTVWEPPHRLAFTWQVGRPVGVQPTLVEVTFHGDDNGTRVELTHSGWEVYGDRAADVHAGYAAPDGWTGVLDRYVKQCDADTDVDAAVHTGS